MRWYLTVIFTCIPLMMASDAEHFSMSLLAIWIFSLGKKIYPDPLSSFLSACLWTSLMAQLVKCLSTMRKTWVPSLGQEDSSHPGGGGACGCPTLRLWPCLCLWERDIRTGRERSRKKWKVFLFSCFLNKGPCISIRGGAQGIVQLCPLTHPLVLLLNNYTDLLVHIRECC